MIQRQQTLWLLLAAVCAILSYQFPFYTGTRIEQNMSATVNNTIILDGANNFFLIILTGASIIVAFIAIFLFKDRKTQLKTTISGIILSFLLLLVYILEVRKCETGHFALACLLQAGILGGFIMATRGIWKDEKLVKSLNKLR